MMRLERFLASCCSESRSQVKKWIRQGKVTINGKVVSEGKIQLEPQKDVVCLSGKELQYEEYQYYMFYKPKGCVCANKDNLHPTVFQYFSKENTKQLFTVGRLDIDTEGLLLITNDGTFSHNLMSPKKHVDKEYWAIWDKPATLQDVALFSEGLNIGDEKPTKPAELIISLKDPKEVRMIISEGRYHQVKRMSLAVGKEVIELKRLRVGRFSLDKNLSPGEYRRFTEEELSYVKEYKSGTI